MRRMLARWVVARNFGWLGRYRRLSKDYERRTTSSEAMVRPGIAGGQRTTIAANRPRSRQIHRSLCNGLHLAKDNHYHSGHHQQRAKGKASCHFVQALQKHMGNPD